MDFQVISLGVIERDGFQFKISGNTFDGYVIVLAKSNNTDYFGIKSFPSPQSARKWIDDLGMASDATI